jgi:hypothetical protein
MKHYIYYFFDLISESSCGTRSLFDTFVELQYHAAIAKAIIYEAARYMSLMCAPPKN